LLALALSLSLCLSPTPLHPKKSYVETSQDMLGESERKREIGKRPQRKKRETVRNSDKETNRKRRYTEILKGGIGGE